MGGPTYSFLRSTAFPTVWWIVFCLCVGQAAQAQNLLPRAIHYDVNSGLADYTITGLAQDPSGMIWVATHQGLQRFDGYGFLTFNRSPENKFRISENDISAIASFRDSFILVQYLNENRFFSLLGYQDFRHRQVSLSSYNGVRGLAKKVVPDYDGSLYCLSTSLDSVYVSRLTAKYSFATVFAIPMPRRRLGAEIDLIPLDGGAFLLNDSDNGLFHVERGRVVKVFAPDDFRSPLDSPVELPTQTKIFFKDRRGRVWISLAKIPVLFRYEAEKRELSASFHAGEVGEFTYAAHDMNSNLILVKTNGIGRYPPGEGIYLMGKGPGFEDVSYLLKYDKYPTAIYSSDLYQTVFWGMSSGLKIFQNPRLDFRHYLASNFPEDQFGEVIRGMCTHRDKHLFISGENNNWYRLGLHDGKIDTLRLYEENTGLRLQFDCSMHLHSDGTYVWGTGCQGLGKGIFMRYDPVSSRVKVYRYPKRLRYFSPTPDGRFLILTFQENGSSELLEFDPVSEQFSEIRGTQKNNPFQRLDLNFLYPVDKDTYWICTSAGLFRLELRTRQIHPLNPDGKSQYRNFQVVQKAPDGGYWLGTTTGLLRYFPESGKTRLYTKQDGLSSDWICGILTDWQGNSWISTYYGISCHETKTGRFFKFSSANGLSHNSMNRYSFFRDDANKKLYFGCTNGVNVFDPAALLKKIKTPKVIATHLSWHDIRDDTRHELEIPRDLKKIELPPYARFIQLEFALPVYYIPNSNQYKSRLVGLENNWTLLGPQHSVRYNQIPPGNYTLRIVGADPQGVWSQQVLEIPVRVQQFFYKRWWFIALSLCLAGGVLFLLYRARWQQKLEIEQLRTKISSDIHDEVSGLLAGISMQAELLLYRVSDQNVQKSVAQIMEVSRRAMYKLSDVLWSVDSRRDNLEDLLLRIREDASLLMDPAGIDYKFETENLPHHMKINVQDRQDIYFIAKELINNVLKHSGANKVSISIQGKGTSFLLLVQDNGVGLPNTPGKNGQGLHNIHMRAQRLNALFSLQQDSPGCIARLELPKFF